MIAQALTFSPDTSFIRCKGCNIPIGKPPARVQTGIIPVIDGQKKGLYHSRECALMDLRKEGIDIEL